jgi:hypothetical protein
VHDLFLNRSLCSLLVELDICNEILTGYRLYRPQYPWAWPNMLYWRKSIRRKRVK